jgi:hypothetical protein
MTSIDVVPLAKALAHAIQRLNAAQKDRTSFFRVDQTQHFEALRGLVLPLRNELEAIRRGGFGNTTREPAASELDLASKTVSELATYLAKPGLLETILDRKRSGWIKLLQADTTLLAEELRGVVPKWRIAFGAHESYLGYKKHIFGSVQDGSEPAILQSLAHAYDSADEEFVFATRRAFRANATVIARIASITSNREQLVGEEGLYPDSSR